MIFRISNVRDAHFPTFSRHSNTNVSVAPANSNTAVSAGSSRLATVNEEAAAGSEAIDLRNLRRKKKKRDVQSVDVDGDNCSESSSKRKSQRLSYVGSEINIIPNPQVGQILQGWTKRTFPGCVKFGICLPTAGLRVQFFTSYSHNLGSVL